MSIRIVVADERQANFFDAVSATAPLADCGSVRNGAAGLKDTDLETDRPGRRYGGTAVASRGSGAAGHHHGVDGERSTEQHDIALFAKEVARRIDADRAKNNFDKLVLIAPPKIMGLLRQSLPTQSQSLLVGEITKDVMHQGEDAILKSIPRELFSTFH
jgi:protein required for attachment to host cells